MSRGLPRGSLLSLRSPTTDPRTRRGIGLKAPIWQFYRGGSLRIVPFHLVHAQVGNQRFSVHFPSPVHDRNRFSALLHISQTSSRIVHPSDRCCRHTGHFDSGGRIKPSTSVTDTSGRSSCRKGHPFHRHCLFMNPAPNHVRYNIGLCLWYKRG